MTFKFRRRLRHVGWRGTSLVTAVSWQPTAPVSISDVWKVDAVKKTIARGLAAAGAATALLALVGSGSAGAINEYDGQTYADAANAIGQSGGTAKIATKVGSFLPTEQCIVTGSRTASFLDSSGNNAGGLTLLDLNCNYMFALPGVPGNSHASPDGKAAYDAAVQQAQEAQDQAAAEQAAAEQAAAENQG